jgi:tetratricopeptide (TPR) repeat protein
VVEISQDRALLADAIDLTGLALHSKERNLDSSLPRCLRYFEQALELRQAINDTRGIAESHFHIGLVYQNKREASDDDMQKALENFQKAYKLALEGGFRFEQAHAARHLAYIYDEQGEQDRAYACHKEFLETNKAIGFKPYLPPANVMMGLAHFKRGELGEAVRYFRTAYGLASEMGSKHFLADASLMLGVTTAAQGDREEALKHLEEAISLAEPIEFTRVINLANREIEKLKREC